MNNTFLAIALLAALVFSYASETPEYEFEQLVSESAKNLNLQHTLEAALPGASKNKMLVSLLGTTEIAQTAPGFDASKVIKIVNGIEKQVKDKYDSHKAEVLKEIKKLVGGRSTISDAQYKPLSSAAKKWCTAYTQQQASKKLLSTKAATKKKKKEQTIPSPKQWDAACSWGFSESTTFKKTDKYSKKTFVPTSAFQKQFNDARKAYWTASKAHFEQDVDHNAKISTSNKMAVVFKTAIDTLAVFEVNQCKLPSSTNKDLVDAFNKANGPRASLHRSLKVLVCTLENMSKTDPKQATDTCVAQLKTEAQYKASIFKNLAAPAEHCPSKAQVLASIAKKKPNLNFHFKGSKTRDATDSSGTLVANQGWTPLAGACAKVPSSAGSWKLELGWCREKGRGNRCGGGCTCEVALSGIAKLSFKEEAAKCEALAGTYKPATAIEVIGSRHWNKAKVVCHIMYNPKVKPTQCPPAACASGWKTFQGQINVASYNGINVSNWEKSRLENRINCAIRQA